jgi:transposase
MTRSYSVDLRVRVIAFVGAGHSRRAAARHFGVSDRLGPPTVTGLRGRSAAVALQGRTEQGAVDRAVAA